MEVRNCTTCAGQRSKVGTEVCPTSCYEARKGEYPSWTPAFQRRSSHGEIADNTVNYGPNDKPVAIKEDGEKNRLDLLPIGPLEDIAEILTFGAKKYADHNWRNGFKWSRLYGALFRHMFAWIKGQDKDPETGKSHLAHAGCCILFLLEHEKRGLGEDDRYKTE